MFPCFLPLLSKLFAIEFLSKSLLLEKSKLSTSKALTTSSAADLPYCQRASSGLRLEISGHREHLARITNSCFVFGIFIFQLPSVYHDNYFIFTIVI